MLLNYSFHYKINVASKSLSFLLANFTKTLKKHFSRLLAICFFFHIMVKLL